MKTRIAAIALTVLTIGLLGSFGGQQEVDASTNSTYTITADTYVKNTEPTTSFGTGNEVSVRQSANTTLLGLFKFSGTPAGTEVTAAELHVRVTNPADEGNMTFVFEQFRCDWGESDTYNSIITSGGYGTYPPGGSFQPETTGWYTIPLGVDLWNEPDSGEACFEVYALGDPSAVTIGIGSRESVYDPYLVITWD